MRRKTLKDYDVGRHTYGDPRIESIWRTNCGKLVVGNFCSIARDVTIFLGGDHHTEWITTSPLAQNLNCDQKYKNLVQIRTNGDVIIENDVWIGTEAVILSGITIGNGSVIGAREVISKDVSPYSIMVGNPAKIARKRFNEEQIEKLLAISWWEWTDEKISDNIKYLLSENINEFIDVHYKEK